MGGLITSQTLITALVGLLIGLTALVSAITANIKNKSTSDKLKAIKQSDLQGLYIICPKCGERVALDCNPIIMAVGGQKDEKIQK